MKMLSCKSMGDPTCNFVAKGETEEEVMDMMMGHIQEKHPRVYETTGEETLKSKMMSKIQEAM